MEKNMFCSKKILLTLSTALIAMSSLSVTSHAAEVFTWVDSQGVKHYSDRPFKKAKKQKLRIAPAKKVEVEEEAEESPDLFDASDSSRLSNECKFAQDNIATLLSGGKVLEKDADGKTIELNTEQMNSKLVARRDYIKRYCRNLNTATSTDAEK